MIVVVIITLVLFFFCLARAADDGDKLPGSEDMEQKTERKD